MHGRQTGSRRAVSGLGVYQDQGNARSVNMHSDACNPTQRVRFVYMKFFKILLLLLPGLSYVLIFQSNAVIHKVQNTAYPQNINSDGVLSRIRLKLLFVFILC